MFSPPHTRHASASAVLPAEPQYWKENIPAGHDKYNSHSFLVLPLGLAQSGYNNAQSVIYTTQMMIIYVISGTLCFNFFQPLGFAQSGFITAPMASNGARLD